LSYSSILVLITVNGFAIIVEAHLAVPEAMNVLKCSEHCRSSRRNFFIIGSRKKNVLAEVTPFPIAGMVPIQKPERPRFW